MSESRKCRKCGTDVPANAPFGHCPQCLIALGFGSVPEKPQFPASEQSHSALGAVRYFGDYELLEKIAQGGMGTVYKARQSTLNRLVALKVISAGALATEDLVKRFKSEAESAASLSHPNIVPIFEIGQYEGQHYFSMGLIEGPTLHEALSQIRNQKSEIRNGSEPPHVGCFEPRKAAQLLSTIARAVHYAHQRGVLHRDLKPSNILLDANGTPHLTDFGLAKLVEKESTLTHTNAVMGTPAYMSPEQARGDTRNVTTAADVYGLGAVLYETLTGSPPFAGGTSMETIRQVLEEEPRRPSIFNRSVDRDLETICLKCLEKDPACRYRSAEALADDLDHWLRSEPIFARPLGNYERVIKWVRRRPAVAALITGLGLSLALGLATSTWQAVRATRAEREQSQLRVKEAGLRAVGEQRLYDSLLAQARALRNARETGYRAEFMELLRQANALQVPQRNLTVLHTEALGSMGDFVGLAPKSYYPIAGKGSSVRRIQMDATGRLAGFLRSDGTIALRNIPSGEEAGVLSTNRPVQDFCFSSGPDELISLHWAGSPQVIPEPGSLAEPEVRFWRFSESNGWIEINKATVPGAIRCFSSTKGLYALTFDSNQPVAKLVELNTLKETASFDFPSSESFQAALSPDGTQLAVSLRIHDGSNQRATLIELWDTQTRHRLRRWDTRLGRPIWIGFSPDGKLLGCLSDVGGGLYSSEHSDSPKVLPGFFEPGMQAAFIPGGTWIALPMTQENRIHLWDWSKGQDVATFTGSGFQLAAHPDGKFLLGCGPNSTRARCFTLAASDGKLRLGGHSHAVTALDFSPDGERLASIGKDGTLKVWNTKDGSKTWESDPLPGPGQTVAYSPDGTLIVTGDTQTRLLQVWDSRTGKRLLELGTYAAGYSWCVAFSADGRFLASANQSQSGGGISVWRIKSEMGAAGKPEIEAGLIGHLPGHFRNMKFLPDNQRLVFFARLDSSSSFLFGANIWEFQGSISPRPLDKFDDHGGPSRITVVHNQGNVLLWNAESQALESVDVESGDGVPFFGSLPADEQPKYDQAHQVVLSPNSRFLAHFRSVFGADVWDFAGKRLLYSLPEETGMVYWMAWSPDDVRLAIARSNGDIAIWNLNAMAEFVAQIESSPQAKLER